MGVVVGTVVVGGGAVVGVAGGLVGVVPPGGVVPPPGVVLPVVGVVPFVGAVLFIGAVVGTVVAAAGCKEPPAALDVTTTDQLPHLSLPAPFTWLGLLSS